MEKHAGDADTGAREKPEAVREQHGRLQRREDRDSVPELDTRTTESKNEVLERVGEGPHVDEEPEGEDDEIEHAPLPPTAHEERDAAVIGPLFLAREQAARQLAVRVMVGNAVAADAMSLAAAVRAGAHLYVSRLIRAVHLPVCTRFRRMQAPICMEAASRVDMTGRVPHHDATVNKRHALAFITAFRSCSPPRFSSAVGDRRGPGVLRLRSSGFSS